MDVKYRLTPIVMPETTGTKPLRFYVTVFLVRKGRRSCGATLLAVYL